MWLAVNKLRKSYRSGGGERRVLCDLIAQFGESEYSVIFGVSGSGKSTLVAILAGLEKADSGDVIAGGFPVTLSSENELLKWRSEHVGLVVQRPTLVGELTVCENVALSLGLDGVEAEKEVRSALEFVGMEWACGSFPAELSVGERQRVSVARALLKRPKLLLADEPTAGLDDDNVLVVGEILKRAAEEFGSVVILCTHDTRLAKFADNRYKLEKGKLQAL